MTAMALAGLGACGLVVWLVMRYSHAHTLARWEFLMARRCREAVDALEQRHELEAHMARDALAGARGADELAEAKRLLSLACWVVQGATPDRLARLRGMMVLVRMAAAVAPVPPVVGPFRLASIRSLSALAGGVHRVLVGSLERFRLRCRVIAWGLRLAVRGLRRASEAADVERADQAVEDWVSLDAEHVTAFRALMESLCAEVATAKSP